MILNELDRHSETWQKIKAHYEARLIEFRKRNDADLSPDKTQKLRGRLAEMNYVLSLADESPLIED